MVVEDKNQRSAASSIPVLVKQASAVSQDNGSHSQPELFADITNHSLLHDSPAKSQPSILKKSIGGRKSLPPITVPSNINNSNIISNSQNSRRVSFAATAHVRVFESATPKAEDKENNDEDDEDASMAAFRQQFVAAASESSNHLTSETDELKASFNQFGIESSSPFTPPSAHASSMDDPATPSKHMSFEVELKAEDQPSFSSYLSPESKDMDLTGCVGDILDDLTSSPLKSRSVAEDGHHLHDDSQERRQTMDFTNCVGSILAQISVNCSDNANAVSSNTVDLPSILADMEMTQAVGQILPVSLGASSLPMDLTQPADSSLNNDTTFHPFFEKKSSSDAVDVSFIGDVDAPVSFDKVLSPSQPVRYASKLKPESAAPSKLSADFSAFEEGDDENENVEMEGANAEAELRAMEQELSMKVDQESLAIAKAAAQQQEQRQHKRKESLGMMQAFMAKGNTYPHIPANDERFRADLREFLNETGVRFLDNLSNMGRRETAGRPRDSTIMTAARRIVVSCVLIPEALAVEKACNESVKTINAQRQLLSEEEERFNHHPPLAWREFMRLPAGESPERTALLTKLRTLKSVGRLFARHSWYEWRRGFEAGLLAELERVRDGLQAQYATLQETQRVLTETSESTIDTALGSARARLSELRRRYDALNRSDWEEAVKLHEQVKEAREQLAASELEEARVAAMEESAQAQVDAIMQERRRLQEHVDQLKQAAAQFDDCTDLALKELKSSRALQEALNGWRLMQLKPQIGFLACEYFRGCGGQKGASSCLPMSFHFHPQTLLVKAVVIEGACLASSSSLLRFAPALVQIPPSLPLPKAVSTAMLQVDRLVQLDRALQAIGIFCQVSLGAVFTCGAPALPITFTFFNYETKSRFEVAIPIHLTAEGAVRLLWESVRFVNHYGPVAEATVRSLCDEGSSAVFVDGDLALKAFASKLSELLKE